MTTSLVIIKTHAALIDSIIQHDGKTRTFIIYESSSLPATPVPFIFTFHGGGGTDSGTMANLTENRWNALADTNGFLVVYPQGWDGHWNDSRSDDTLGSNEDDVGFIDSLITTLTAQYNIDTQKIFACGMSNGAMFLFRLAIERADTFAAVFSCTGAIPAIRDTPDNPSTPISVMYLAGTLDQWIPFAGGEISPFLGPGRGTVISAYDTIDYWKTQLQLSATPVVSTFPDTVTADASTVTAYAFLQGAGGSQFSYYEINGGGHAWPAAIPNTTFEENTLRLGKKNQGILACDEAWAFFQNKSLILNTPTPTPTITTSSTVSPTATLTITSTPYFSATPTSSTTATTITPTSSLTPFFSPTATKTTTSLTVNDVLAYPSPARRNTLWFYYNLESPAQVTITIYTIAGEQCASIQDQKESSDSCKSKWNIKDIAAGLYFYQVTIQASNQTKLLPFKSWQL